MPIQRIELLLVLDIENKQEFTKSTAQETETMMRTTTTTALLVTMAAALFISSASAWVPPSMATFTMRSTRTRLQAIEAATVESLENHEEEGTLMAESIARWLDAEVSERNKK